MLRDWMEPPASRSNFSLAGAGSVLIGTTRP